MKTLDNLITWGWADHVLEVTPESVDEILAGSSGAATRRRSRPIRWRACGRGRRRRSRSGSGCR